MCCRVEEEEQREKSTSFDLEKYYPNLEKTIKDLLFGNAQFDKLESFNVSPYLTERFIHTLNNNSKLSVKLAFHGTMTSNFPNIQKRGFLVPGKSGLPIVNGNAYGSGIYLSACPKMSLSYVRDQPRLLVCAVLEGDRSKVLPHGVIRVAKDPAYVLPCFILHYKGTTPRKSSGYQRLMSNPNFHTFLFCLISLFKLLVLLIGISIICFIGSFSCLGYSYIMDKPPIELCYDINTIIWHSYVYIFYSIICYGFYYIILWPLYFIVLGFFYVSSSILGLISWILFWIIYYTLVIILNTNMIGLGFCILAIVMVTVMYGFRHNRSSRSYFRRKNRIFY